MMRGSRFAAIALLLILIAFLASAAGTQAQPRKPNILFAIADDWSYGHAGAYGCRWVKTPAFDRVAKQGILFTNAFTPNAKCAPSRSCILTGRNPWQLKAAANHVPFFPPEFKSYPEALAEHGYFVGKTAKGWAPGVAQDAAGKPRQMTGQPFDKRTAPPPATGIGSNDYAANFEDFLNAAPLGRPWCFWYGSVEPHRGYEYGSGVAKGGKKISDIDRIPGYWPDNEVVRNDLLDYAYEVEHFDRHLGRMLEMLEKRGLLDNTLVMVTSDNGMPFPHNKGQAYLDANHLPLAAMWKEGIRAPGRVVNDYVSFIDFAPTFVEAAGLQWKQTGMAPAEGRSLSDLFRSEKGGRVNPQRDHVLIGKERTDIGRPNDGGYPIRGIVKDDLLYLRNFEPSRWPGGNPETGYLDCDGGPTKTEVLKSRLVPQQKRFWDLCFGMRPQEELYNLKVDPDSLDNLADRREFLNLRTPLQTQLFAELKKQEDPRMFGKGEVFDQYPYAEEKMRGFYERFMKGEKIRAGWVNESDFEKPLPPSGAAEPARRPNFIVIVADDLAYADVGFNGCKDIPTPHIDSLAAHGVRFSNAYVSHPFCSPTRAGLLAGIYQQRFGHENNPLYDPENSKLGLPLDQVLLPRVLKDAGYATGAIGKWHLGATPAFHPNERGFSDYFGFLGGGHVYLAGLKGSVEYTIPILRNRQPVEEKEYLTDAFSREAVEFIERHKAHPFFLYLAYNAVHTPLQATEKYLSRFTGIADERRRALAAMNSAMDDGIGSILKAVRERALERETLIFFFSDNGGPITVVPCSNAPLRGGKGQVYEGGIRVPFVMRWPGQLPEAVVYNEPVISLDVYPTTAALAGAKIPGGRRLDGVNIFEHAAGRLNIPPHDRLYWRTGGGASWAVREGRYKLVKPSPEAGLELYDLQNDIAESRDLSGEQTAIVERLRKAYDTWNAELIPPLWESPRAQPGRKK